MAIPLFLAAHPAEVAAWPEHYAWMACRFSEQGLTNLPQKLPEGAMVILTDEIPPRQQDPELVAKELSQLSCSAILLDFQRPGCDLTARITAEIAKHATCPVGVAESYANAAACAVFLSPVPPERPLEDHLRPWWDRELWLDLSPSPTRITVTSEGSQTEPLRTTPTAGSCHRDQALCCHYKIQITPKHIDFDLWRTKEDLTDLLSVAESLGVTLAIGLYQELGDW